MGGEIVSLRMVVIAAAQSDQELWRAGVAMASIPVEFLTPDTDSATSALVGGKVDICVLDEALPDTHKNALVKAVRSVKPAPLIFMCAPRGRARCDGIDGMLTKPANVEDARKLAELCIRTKIPTRVLIVDDSSTMRSIVRKILAASRFRMQTYEAAEGISALDQLRTGKFGLVFLDYNMPGFNGFETLSEIKRENPDVSVVMMTSTLDNAIADRAHAAGVLAFLKKPFYPSDIDAVLERYFGLHVAVSEPPSAASQ
jgi:DNA-binding NtrC family response regulator